MEQVQAEEEERNMDELSVDMSDGDASDVEGGEQEKIGKEYKEQEERESISVRNMCGALKQRHLSIMIEKSALI
eukprot:5406828-Ditylum_brightwellii.AAC.1